MKADNHLTRVNTEWVDTPILKGLQIYHNFIRPHEGLNGDTPSERAGIRVEGPNKWLTIIQNASKENNER